MKKSTRYRIYYLLRIAGVTHGTRARVWRQASSNTWTEDRAQGCVSWLDSVTLDPRYFPGVPDALMSYALKKRMDNERD